MTNKTKEPFWLGGAAASMAVCFTHPLDQTKYRMQVLKSSDSMITTMSRFAARDGITSLWAGLSASILRQGTYSTARFGLHSSISSAVLTKSGRESLPFTWNVACAGVAGGIAGLVGNPTEVILVRMCADGAKNTSDRFVYSNAVQGLIRIGREEGIGAFTKALTPNIVRSVLMNVAQIATYSSAKRYILKSIREKDDVATHALASLAAGTVATTVCAPADVLKSRMQSSAGGDGLSQIIRQGLKEEGPRFLMKGWTPAWLRLTPHTVLTFVFMEQLRKLTQFSFLSHTTQPAKL